MDKETRARCSEQVVWFSFIRNVIYASIPFFWAIIHLFMSIFTKINIFGLAGPQILCSGTPRQVVLSVQGSLYSIGNVCNRFIMAKIVYNDVSYHQA